MCIIIRALHINVSAIVLLRNKDDNLYYETQKKHLKFDFTKKWNNKDQWKFLYTFYFNRCRDLIWHKNKRKKIFTDMDKRPNACRFKNWHQIKLNNETVSQVWLKPEPHFSQSFHAKKTTHNWIRKRTCFITFLKHNITLIWIFRAIRNART